MNRNIPSTETLPVLLVALFLASCGAASQGGYEAAVSEPYASKSSAYGGDYGGYSGGGGGGMADSYSAAPMLAAESEDYYEYDDEYWGDETGYVEMAPGPSPVTAALETPVDKPTSTGDPGPPVETKTDAGGKKPDRVILYVAEMSLSVFRIDEKIDEIREMIKTWDGYLISMDSNKIVFRVPAGTFEDALEQIEDLGDVTYRNVNGTDVTDEYRDLQIRLKNAIAVRDRLLELLSDAKTIQDSLQVEHELERITEKIELMKGRLKYISEAASYSKITVHLAVKQKAKKPIPPLYAPFKWIQDIGLDTLFNF